MAMLRRKAHKLLQSPEPRQRLLCGCDGRWLPRSTCSDVADQRRFCQRETCSFARPLRPDYRPISRPRHTHGTIIL